MMILWLFGPGVTKTFRVSFRVLFSGPEMCFVTLSFRVSYKKQQKIICVKAKNLDRIDICLAEKLKSVMATKCFHLATSSYNE